MTQFCKIAFPVLFSLFFDSSDAYSQQEGRPAELRCEHLVNPLGIDAVNPRLSWKMIDGRAGAKQTSFQILVSNDSLKLRDGIAEIWDTEWIISDEALVTFSGRTLKPFTIYYWKVEITDHLGKKSQSNVARFETGMMDMAGWQGAWISDGTNIETKAAPYFR